MISVTRYKPLVYKEGNFWRWWIKDRDFGKTYVDDGNFLSKEDAHKSLAEALVVLENPTL